jgi:hypothetical protein
MGTRAALYDGVRHLLFVSALTILAAAGWMRPEVARPALTCTLSRRSRGLSADRVPMEKPSKPDRVSGRLPADRNAFAHYDLDYWVIACSRVCPT